MHRSLHTQILAALILLTCSACSNSGWKLAIHECERTQSLHEKKECKRQQRIGGREEFESFQQEKRSNSFVQAWFVGSGKKQKAQKHYKAAQKYAANGFKRMAIQEYQKSAKLRPDHPTTFYNMALLQKELQDTKHALESIQNAISKRPKWANAYFQKGVLHMQAGQYKQALESYLKAVETRQGYLEAYWNLAFLSEDLNDTEHALYAYQEILKIFNHRSSLNDRYWDQFPEFRQLYKRAQSYVAQYRS